MKRYKFFIKFLVKIFVLALFFWLVLMFVIEPYRMSGNMMFPGVRDGDLGLFYQLDKAYVGDVILYEVNGKEHVGRVIAYGGQTVDFPEAGGYTVNGYSPFEEITYETYGKEGQTYPVEVPDGAVFVLNDFRSDMSDSRSYGVIEEDEIHGKLLFLLRRRNF